MILEVSAASLPALYEAAARALSAFLIDPSDVGQTLREKFSIEAIEPVPGLKNLANSLLDLAALQKVAFTAFKVSAAGASLQVEALGELLDPHRHQWRASPELWHCVGATVIPGPPFEAKISLEKR